MRSDPAGRCHLINTLHYYLNNLIAVNRSMNHPSMFFLGLFTDASVFAGGHNLLRSRLTYPIIPHSKFSTSKMADSATTVAEQFFDNFLVLDFEATCSNERKMTPQVCVDKIIYHV